MSLIKKLMDGAAADVDVLHSLNKQGDDFSKFRHVDFLLRSPSKDKAELVASFVNDFRYGDASAMERDGAWAVQVVIHMPVQQGIITSVAGFMTCLAELYGLEFDGWGCIAQTASN